MFVKVKCKVKIPFSNLVLEKGEILEVDDVRGNYYICYINDKGFAISKQDCEPIEQN